MAPSDDDELPLGSRGKLTITIVPIKPERTVCAAIDAYEAKLEAKRQRFTERAAKERGVAATAFSSARRAANGIPMGQPILVGHHSERRHRKDLERMDTGMRKGIAATEKAAELEHRAEAVGTAGISSDDPEAITKLEAELAGLEAGNALAMQWNKILRTSAKGREKRLDRKLTQADHLDLITELLTASEDAMPKVIADAMLRVARAFPWLPTLKSNTADQRRVKGRIAELKLRDAAPERAPLAGAWLHKHDDGTHTPVAWTLEENKAANRTQITFLGQPPRELREKLKAAGFKWAPSVSVWQRNLSIQAWHRALAALGVKS